MKIKIQKISEHAKIPTQGTTGAAGYDLYASETEMICKGDVRLVKTGIKLEIPVGYEGQVRSRSGLAKDGLIVANSPGTIDCDYRGEVGVLLINHGHYNRIINRGDRIAQLVIQTVPTCEFVEAEVLSDTDRGAGGFGSTGTA